MNSTQLQVNSITDRAFIVPDAYEVLAVMTYFDVRVSEAMAR